MHMRIASIFALLFLTALVAVAQEGSDIRRRMEQRLPAIDEMKTHQIVGENNRGLLDVRGAASAAQQRLVADENSDRTSVYGLIAKQTGSSSDAVGRARAKKIAENSRPGVWLQDESGRWYKK